ncbi:MAG: hypothetical protein WD273_03835 [Trueperaceae bacterium]
MTVETHRHSHFVGQVADHTADDLLGDLYPRTSVNLRPHRVRAVQNERYLRGRYKEAGSLLAGRNHP